SFATITLDKGFSSPSCRSCSAHKQIGSGREADPLCRGMFVNAGSEVIVHADAADVVGQMPVVMVVVGVTPMVGSLSRSIPPSVIHLARSKWLSQARRTGSPREPDHAGADRVPQLHATGRAPREPRLAGSELPRRSHIPDAARRHP